MNILQRDKIFSKFTTRFEFRKKRETYLINGFQGVRIKNDYSINQAPLFFINFLSVTGTSKQKAFLLKLKRDSVNKNILSSKDFYNRSLENYKTDETQRLLSIINSYEDTSITSITELFKCKYKNEEGCQLYLTYNRQENCMDVVLIDLYHLALPADYQVRKNTTLQKSPEKQYRDKGKYNYDIKNILTYQQDKRS